MHKGLKIVFLPAILFSVWLYGCSKQGCKDPKALNYDPGAKVENATCLYCDSSTSYTSVVVPAFDNTQSPAQNVANAIFNQGTFSYFGNGCVSVNKQAGAACSVSLNIVNLTTTRMSGECEINFESGFGQSGWTYTQTFSEVGPKDTLKVGIINNNCDSIVSGSFTVQLFNMSYN